MNRPCFTQMSDAALPVYLVSKDDLKSEHDNLDVERWIRQINFKANEGDLQLVPGSNGQLAGALFGAGADIKANPMLAGTLAKKLPDGDWYLADEGDSKAQLALGFGLGSYQFERYRNKRPGSPKLVFPEGTDAGELLSMVDGCFLARDLINTPVNDMGPVELEQALRTLAKRHDASVVSIEGDDLLAQNFPLIHAVGRASVSAPRLLDLRWGPADGPKVTLVGKGVCFDTGGLDIKPPAGMLLMKKDMGGAANVLGLASMIMDAKLPVRLRVLIPAVENSIAGNAFRPGDVIKSRKGPTIEIGNTDAEGRLVLADALSLADEEEPQLMVDMATLTGAARVALGPDLPPYYCHCDNLSLALEQAGRQVHDPVWRLPLYAPYDRNLSSPIADINNAPAGGMAGSVIAALFLNRFVEKTTEWIHFDIYGWNPKEKPQSPVGGEAQAIRALYYLLCQRYR